MGLKYNLDMWTLLKIEKKGKENYRLENFPFIYSGRNKNKAISDGTISSSKPGK